VHLRNLTAAFIFAALAAILCVSQDSGVKASKITRVRGNVLSIEDSDRVKIAADDGNVYTAFIAGIDAPDQKQDYFKKAVKRLSEMTRGKDVTVMLRGGESDQTFAVIYVGGDDVGLKMIEEGLAWYSPGRSVVQNSADREKYSAAQTAARSKSVGLWDDKDPVAPWVLRGEKSELPVETEEMQPAAPAVPRSQPVPGRTYTLGPRGGCYYLNGQGIKVYVKDKTLCSKPQ
jgi:endonuclease YncB( thermonuclease family)